jgi:beta-glucosidase
MMTKRFPDGFMWGTATASFQIEGATRSDGRGESIWDRFAATPGKVHNGDTGDPACESYYRYQEDITLMKAMNNNAYRFSIAWPRVIPDGDGDVAQAGLDYYDRLVDALLAAGITPVATLYHWDLPQALQDKGGWGNRTTIDAFNRYTDVTVSRLGDRIGYWATFNEPWCISILSHALGAHAPGLEDRKLALQVAHHVLVAHGSGLRIIRQRSPKAKAGIVLNMEPAYPAMDIDADRRLADLHHATFNLWFLDPVMGRGYPQNAWVYYGADVPEIRPDDMDTIHTPLDFLGLNYYTRHISHDPNGGDGPILHQRDNRNVSARNWEIFPHGLYELLTWLHRDYPEIPEISVTENGIACHDVVENGRVHDPQRISYLKQHLEAAWQAANEGVPLKGYFAWSLMDNFEWAAGYDSRFGLAYVNFETQERILKDSAQWYGRAAAANALPD